MQTKLGSLIEALAGTAVGMLISVIVSHYLYPLYGWTPSLAVNFEITAIFTVVSIIRGYVLRRIFTRLKGLHQ